MAGAPAVMKELPPQEEIGPDEQGIKTVIFYRRNEKGQVEKVTRKYQVTTSVRKVPQAVIERHANWRPFGDAARDNKGATAVNVEAIHIERPGEPVQETKKEQKTPSGAQVCRLCGGPHFAMWCPLKKMGGGPAGPAAAEPEPESTGSGAGGMGGGKYVPPSARGGAGGSDGPAARPEEITTLRVSNLPDDDEVREEDLRAIFARYGHITRVFIARQPPPSQICKGFAYVTFLTRKEADDARIGITANKIKFQHRIIAAGWGKAATDKPGGGAGGIGSMGTDWSKASGYGKALPQNMKPGGK